MSGTKTNYAEYQVCEYYAANDVTAYTVEYQEGGIDYKPADKVRLFDTFEEAKVRAIELTESAMVTQMQVWTKIKGLAKEGCDGY